MKQILCVLVVLYIVGHTIATDRIPSCGENRVWNPYGPRRPPTCQNPNNTQVCPDDYNPGCYCKCGYLLDEKSGECVPRYTCPPVTCDGPNEEFTKCASVCPETCQNICRRPAACPFICVQDCVCKDGYIRDEVTCKCIPRRECPRCCNKVCPKDKVLDQCPNPCQPTCEVPTPPVCNSLLCSCDCICKEGWIKDDKTGDCIPPEKCPGGHPNCGKNEQWDPKGSPCHATCQQPNRPMICKAAPKAGCYCVEGFIRDEVSGKCIRIKDCPRVVLN